MISIKIRSGRESQQDNNSYSQGDGYDEYGEYVGHIDHQDTRGNTVSQSECCICGGEILSNHLVFKLGGTEHEIHTPCLITSAALIVNGVGLIAKLFKKASKKKRIGGD